MANWPGKSSGLAIDVTCVSRWVRRHEDAVREKTRKYRAYFEEYSTMGFAPFAMELTGDVHPDAVGTVGQLARMMAQQPANHMRFEEAMSQAWGDLAWTFVDEIVRQIKSSADCLTRVRC